MNNISNRPDSNYPPMSDSEWANAPFNEEIEKFYEVLKNKEFPKDIEYWKRECKQWQNDDIYRF